MHPMPREGTETVIFLIVVVVTVMHPMPREGTETVSKITAFYDCDECILCPVRGRKRNALAVVVDKIAMHPMPREGTETVLSVHLPIIRRMHPMPREGKETKFLLFHDFRPLI